MNIPQVPPSICQDAGHAELVIIGLLILSGFFAKAWWKARQEVKETEESRLARIEGMLTQAISNHVECQKQLPTLYLARHDFERFLEQRSREWSEFRADFKEFTDTFREHRHDDGGRVK